MAVAIAGRGTRTRGGRFVTRPRYAIAVVGVVVAALLAVLAGAIPIRASSGHWRTTAWVLDLIKRRSVNTYSRLVVDPGSPSPAAIVRGAAHFDSGCRPCHGSPLAGRPALVMRMTPHPPHLTDRIARWDGRELFYIVKHGIKFTGMPAWTAPQRDDEVWSMVAFLKAMPAMSSDTYRQLAIGDSSAAAGGISPIERCARCHGRDGMGRDGAFPVLAGQRFEYLVNALIAYKAGQRHSGMMKPEADSLDDATRHVVAAHFSGLPRSASSTRSDTAGGAIAARGIMSRQVPACAECHGPASADRQPAYPLLAGQHADFLFEQLRWFAEGRRGGSAYAAIMQPIAARLTREDMRAVAAYYAALPPE
jgi:cytochrome c553